MRRDRLIGRISETARLGKLLGEARVVTVTGPPGIGKTRLALGAVAGLGNSYADGCRTVDLTRLRDGRLLGRALAEALDLGEVHGEDIVETVISYLMDRHVLIVLDNCEHLVEACAIFARRVVHAAPAVSLLLTSRELIAIDGEHVLALGPLSLPPPVGEEAGGEIMESDAVELFVDRARAARTGFSVSGGELSLVAEICRRVEGVPLAIELVAARVGELSLAEVVHRLERGLAVVATDGEPPVHHHRSMELALDWSHALLSDAEGAVFRRLSGFTSGWTADAAAEICAGSPAGDSVLHHLQSLVARSLVVVDASAGTVRYRLLEPIRSYAADRLVASGEVEDLSDRHAHWYAAMAERAAVGLTAADQLAWLDLVDADHDNLRSALAWAVERRCGSDALRLAGGLALFWRLRSYLGEGRQWLDLAHELDEGADPALRCRAVWGAGLMALMVGDARRARAHLEQALQLSREAGDAVYEARSILLLGNDRIDTDLVEALALLEEAARSGRPIGDSWCAGLALGLAGRIHLVSGNLALAREVLEECIAVARDANELQSLRLGLIILGEVASASGQHREAEERLREGLSIARQLRENYAVAAALSSLGDVALRQSQGKASGRGLVSTRLSTSRRRQVRRISFHWH